MSDLRKLCKMIWDFRREMDDRWPTPDRIDSLRYALTKIAEAMDAWLRLSRPGDKRNRDKDIIVENELADTAIMLLTALGEDFSQESIYFCWRDTQATIDEMCYLVAVALRSKDDLDILGALDAVWSSPVVNLAERISVRLARIKLKHAPMVTWDQSPILPLDID